mgnify:CR=1 FL=1
MKTTATPLVFVSLYVSLGDADGSIEGYKVMPLTKFEAHLEAEGISGVYNEGEWGGYEVNLENSPGDFRLPTDFI